MILLVCEATMGSTYMRGRGLVNDRLLTSSTWAKMDQINKQMDTLSSKTVQPQTVLRCTSKNDPYLTLSR